MKELNDIDLRSLIEQETGEKFNRDGYIKCPFHLEKTPSMSVKFFPNANKQRYKCWGCECQGDAIDFIMNYKNMEYNEARKYLGLEVENNPTEDFEETIRKFVRNQVAKGNKKGYKPLGIFTFVDENNKPIYSKVKFLKPDGKKETPYYHVEDGQVICNRSHEEVPYNYYNLLQGIANNKIVVIVEGEKDANTLSHLLNKNQYVITSLKDFKNYDKIKSEFMKIYVIGDTGKAGLKYVDNIKYNFLSTCKNFKIINLQGIQALGDNKDVTDWLEAGHTKEDLFNAFNRSLDLKNKYELQQDFNGVYKTKFNKEGEPLNKVYIADFQVIEAKVTMRIDDETEDITLKLKSKIDGKIYTKTKSSSVLNDLRSFRNFLGAKLFFQGDRNDLVAFARWISTYFTIDDDAAYQGARFNCIDGKLTFSCLDGTISANGIETSAYADENNIKLTEVEKITAAELLELKKKIFRFSLPEKTISIIGTIINDLAVYQNMAIDEKLHHLLIVGESESGKSTILERIIAPILNYPLVDKLSVSSAKPFGLAGSLCQGNYPLICDEFKPSTWTQYKSQEVCNTMRDAYDRTPMVRGDKSFKIKRFIPERPIIIAGEESYPNQEKALITRSCIVYMSKNERTEESSAATFWLIDHKDILNKFGRSLIDEILNMPVEQYKEIRDSIKEKFSVLQDRALNIALNIGCGIEIFNILLERHRLNRIENYEQHIIKNIQEEVLDGGKEAKSVVEQMLILYNDMIEDGKTTIQEDIIQDIPKEGMYIRTPQLINEIFLFKKQYESAEVVPLKLKDFRKQATKAGYILKVNAKQIRIQGKQVWFDLYNRQKLKELTVTSIIEPDLIAEAVTQLEENMFAGV